jgi:UDP-N-acetylglucosamine 1-carboxyvinyltransferase
MEVLKILGQTQIGGSVRCAGAKNLAPKVIIACLLCRSVSIIHNVPNIFDVLSVIDMCRETGAIVDYDGYTLTIDSTNLSSGNIEKDSAKGRISPLYAGILIHFFDKISVPVPYGCELGDRSIDIHLDILTKFGLSVTIEDGKLEVEKVKNIKSRSIKLPYPSVGATETAIFLSVLSQGRSVIHGIAIEPEIMSLISFLQQCGAIIRHTGDREISIEGVSSLSGSEFTIFGDRLETAGWACLACAADTEIRVDGIEIENMRTFLGPFMMIGGGFRVVADNSILFYRKEKVLRSIFLETGPYPLFSTDYQPLISTLMMIAKGSSIIHETLFNKRLDYLYTLEKFGAEFTLDDHCYGNSCRFAHTNSDHSAIINGVDDLFAPSEIINADTLRSGFAYIIAASIAKGETNISGMNQMMRGYSDIRNKLRKLGVGIDAEVHNLKLVKMQ